MVIVDGVRNGIGSGLETIGDGIKWIGVRCRQRRLTPLQKAKVIAVVMVAAAALLAFQAMTLVGALVLLEKSALPATLVVMGIVGHAAIVSNLAFICFVQRAVKNRW
jgi:hypothetical protein